MYGCTCKYVGRAPTSTVSSRLRFGCVVHRHPSKGGAVWVGTVLVLTCTYVLGWGGSRRTGRVTGGSDVGRWVRAGCVSD